MMAMKNITISRRKALALPFVPLLARISSLLPRAYSVGVSVGAKMYHFTCRGDQVQTLLARFNVGMATIGRNGQMYGVDLAEKMRTVILP